VGQKKVDRGTGEASSPFVPSLDSSLVVVQGQLDWAVQQLARGTHLT
jgi:hypothetical protein